MFIANVWYLDLLLHIGSNHCLFLFKIWIALPQMTMCTRCTSVGWVWVNCGSSVVRRFPLPLPEIDSDEYRWHNRFFYIWFLFDQQTKHNDNRKTYMHNKCSIWNENYMLLYCFFYDRKVDDYELHFESSRNYRWLISIFIWSN